MDRLASLLPGWWMRWWFPPVPLLRLAAFRVAVTVFALVDVAVASTFMLRYTTTDRMFLDPVHLLRAVGTPIPPPELYVALLVVLAGALVLALVGYRTRLALMVAAPLYLYQVALFNSWGKVNHGKIPIIAALFVLAVAPAGARLSIDALRTRVARARAGGSPGALAADDRLAGWVFRLIGVILVASYVLSVAAKLQNSGPGWVWGPVLQPRMLAQPGMVPEFLAANPLLLQAFQATTLAAEALAFLAFFGGMYRNVVLTVLGAFHVGSYVLMQTEFFGFMLCFLVFFRLEDGIARLGAWARARGGGERLVLRVDTGCASCRALAARIDALDWRDRVEVRFTRAGDRPGVTAGAGVADPRAALARVVPAWRVLTAARWLPGAAAARAELAHLAGPSHVEPRDASLERT